jgi:hypothetical protein
MSSLIKFLNSGLGLVLVGALIGAIGLFTWQRTDWLFKQRYLREQVLLDRRVELIEKINADVGALVADADAIIAVIVKDAPASQRTEAIQKYNEEQARWFGASASHLALAGFYFPQKISTVFADNVIDATMNLDVKGYQLTKEDTLQTRENAYAASRRVREELQAWNKLAMRYLQSR